jgi:hypothetical protein
MIVEREVIIDLLPAYFSGEASAATRALVEEYFRQDPEFEKMARGSGSPLESLQRLSPAPDPEKEKLALERARTIVETRSALLWLAITYTLLLLLFRIRDHKIVWIMWSNSPVLGMVFSSVAAFFWLFFLYAKRSKEPLRAYTKSLWMAVFYTLFVFLFRIKDHKIVWIFFDGDSTVGLVFGAVAVAIWIRYFFERRRARRSGL